jgi:hypothetical protein
MLHRVATLSSWYKNPSQQPVSSPLLTALYADVSAIISIFSSMDFFLVLNSQPPSAIELVHDSTSLQHTKLFHGVGIHRLDLFWVPFRLFLINDETRIESGEGETLLEWRGTCFWCDARNILGNCMS